MSFNDDEPIVASQDVSGEKPAAFLAGKTKATIINKTTAPLEHSELKVMLELTRAGSGNDRSGVDLVTVLDVSSRMDGEKLEKMKIAMLFMIKKLSPIDRLSIVTFNGGSQRLCPLRQITENSQAEIEKLVNALVADGGANISIGLQTGLKVLNDRRLTSGRVVGIMLLSDGQQNAGGDAAQVPVGKVPIYTFGIGADQDPRVLKAIADNSMGGTFSDVQNQDNLSIAFSQCLDGLLGVVAQDLKLTIRQDNSTIVKVSAGNYPRSKVIVDLLLPATSSPTLSDVLNITYSSGGKLFDANPMSVTVSRTGRTSVEPEREEVMMEETRLRTARMIKEPRVVADDKKLGIARDKLVEAQNLLEDVVNDESNPLIEMLKSELQQTSRLMRTQEIYEKQGRPLALSSETSHVGQRFAARGDDVEKQGRHFALSSETPHCRQHFAARGDDVEKQGCPFAPSLETSEDRQRFAARGDDVEKLRLFATPRMDAYLEQAKSFDKDPSKPLPSVDEASIP